MLNVVIASVFLPGLFRSGKTDPNRNNFDQATQANVMNWVLKRVPPDESVVAGFQLHPVFRRDTFYKTVVDLSNTGDRLEELMPRVVSDSLAKHFQPSGYEELEARPPAIIFIQGTYTPMQNEAVNVFPSRHPNSYAQMTVPFTGIMVLERVTPLTPK